MSRSIRGTAIGVATALALTIPACATTSDPVRAAATAPADGWSATWATAPQRPAPGWTAPNWSVDGFAGHSLRQVVRVSAGGSQVRIRLSNRYGAAPLRVAGATVADAGEAGALRPGPVHHLTFDGRAEVVVAPGEDAVSDGAPVPVSALESLAVTLRLVEPTGPATFHETALSTSYRAPGDHLADPESAAYSADTTQSWYYVTAVEVAGGEDAHGTVVAFGDSITDGFGSTPDTDRRYPDALAAITATADVPLPVVNAGVNGNKLLSDSPCYGESGVSRFQRDALDQLGVRTVVVLEGINDIGGGGYPDFGCGASPVVSADQLISGHRELIRAAHERGVRIVGATLTPMRHAAGYDTPANEAVRDALNHWIRTSGEYDDVVDLDRALADPADPGALRQDYDSGDHLHPDDAGAAAIAAAVAPHVR